MNQILGLEGLRTKTSPPFQAWIAGFKKTAPVWFQTGAVLFAQRVNDYRFA
jgi:hypothetical protein